MSASLQKRLDTLEQRSGANRNMHAIHLREGETREQGLERCPAPADCAGVIFVSFVKPDPNRFAEDDEGDAHAA